MKLLNWKLYIILAFSVLIIILNNFILDLDCSPKLNKIVLILSNLSLAYISSFIFYYVVVVSREKFYKKIIYKSVSQITKKVIFHGYYVYDVLQKKEHIQLDYSKAIKIERDNFIHQCDLVNPNDMSKFSILIEDGIKNLSKIESLHYQCIIYLEEDIRRIFIYLPYLDLEHIKLLNAILDSELFKIGNGLNLIKTHQNFKDISEKMYDYFLTIRELDKYFNNKIKTFA